MTQSAPADARVTLPARRAEAPSTSRFIAPVRDLAWSLAVPVVVLALWETLAAAGMLDPRLFSRPSAILAAAAQQVASGALVANAAASLAETALGFVLAALIGVPLGIVMGSWRRVDYMLEPFVIGLYSAPIVALYPLLIIWFGLGFSAMLVLVVLFAVFPIVVNTSLGVRTADSVLVRTGRSFGATPAEIVTKIILPAALPSILAGLRLAAGRALIGVVVAELFMGTAGLGYAIGVAAGTLRTADVFVGIFVLGIVGTGLTALVGAFERRLIRQVR